MLHIWVSRGGGGGKMKVTSAIEKVPVTALGSMEVT